MKATAKVAIALGAMAVWNLALAQGVQPTQGTKHSNTTVAQGNQGGTEGGGTAAGGTSEGAGGGGGGGAAAGGTGVSGTAVAIGVGVAAVAAAASGGGGTTTTHH